jgi:hypothetical protein
MPETLAERFWSIARVLDRDAPEHDDPPDPVIVVRHVLRVLDALEQGQVGDGVTTNTINFLTMLRQYELRGDLAYASPEQARGEQVDERSLVFSVGVLLFEKLTGRHPFGEKTNPRRVARIQKGEMGSGVNFFPHVPASLRSVLMKAMGPFPDERWESLAALRAELEAFLEEETTPRPVSRPVTIMPRSPSPTPAATPAPPPRTARGTSPPVPGSVFGDVFEDDGPTKLVSRPLAAGTSPRPITAPGATIRSAGVTLPSAEPARLPLPLARRLALPAAWIALGAGLTAAAFLFFGPAPRPEPVRAAAAAKAEPASPVWATARASATQAGPEVMQAVRSAAPAAAPAPAPEPAAAPVAAAAPAAEVPPAPAPEPAAPAPAAPGVFDPKASGDAALAAMRPCFGKAASFGAGIAFGKDGLVRKVYFGSVNEIGDAERVCVNKALHALPAAGRPDKAVVVEYWFRVRADGGEVKVKR